MKSEVPYYAGGVHPNCDYHHGMIPYEFGVKLYQVTRANRSFPELADNTDMTYKHAPDLCYFHGKFYIQYLCTPVDEHFGRGISILATSDDGKDWKDFKVSFPEYLIPACEMVDYKGIKHVFTGKEYAFMHQRICFYRSSKDRMLLLGFYGYSPEKWMTNWDNYGIGRVVRELYADGTFSEIYFLIPNYQAGWKKEQLLYPLYSEAEDKGFVNACEELLQDKLVAQSFAEENGDSGEYISVKHPKPEEGRGSTYQAFCYYHLDDKNVIGLWKHSFTARSYDGGNSFQKVEKSPSLVMSGQKIWGQKTKDGFALCYVPTLESQHRYPLCVVHSRDGLEYDEMHLIHGEVPTMRYGGFWKDFGAQYMRGIGEHIYEENDMPNEEYYYLTYSVNKEDIWIAHIPNKNCSNKRSVVYQPKWCEVREESDGDKTHLIMHDREPIDYCKWSYELSGNNRISFDLNILKYSKESAHKKQVLMEFENLKHQAGIRLWIDENGSLYIRTTAPQKLMTCEQNRTYHFEIEFDCEEFVSKVKVTDDSGKVLVNRKDRFLAAVNEITAFSIQTGSHRSLPTLETDPDTWMDLPNDVEKPCDEIALEISNLEG